MARRTKEDACATRNSLLDAAEQVFLEQGVARASLNEIAQRAGATRGAVYWHFKDKLDLFYAMLDRVTLPLEQLAYGENAERHSLQGVPRVRHIIASVFRRLEQDAQTRRVFEVLLFKVEYVGELVAVQERHLFDLAEFDSRLEECLRVEQARQECASMVLSPFEAALGLRSLFDGLIKSWLLSSQGFDLSELGMRAVDVYLGGLGFQLPVEGSVQDV